MSDLLSPSLTFGLLAVFISAGLVAISAWSLRYLTTRQSSPGPLVREVYSLAARTEGQLENLRLSFSLLQEDIEKASSLQPAELSDEFKAELLQSAKSALPDDVAQTVGGAVRSALSEFDKKVTAAFAVAAAGVVEAESARLTDRAEVTRSRLVDEVFSQQRRANLNLVIGMGISLVAISFLGFIVLGTELDVSDLPSVAATQGARFSLVILIELFGYFFLRLYRAGLAEIKYFQTTLTTLESRIMALQSALERRDTQVIRVAIEALGRDFPVG